MKYKDPLAQPQKIIPKWKEDYNVRKRLYYHPDTRELDPRQIAATL